MKKINLLKRAVKQSGPTYILDIEIISSEGIIHDVFVKQRLRNTNNGFDDVFAAVATVAQLESLDIGSPAAGQSYFLDHKVSVVATNPAYLQDVFNTILAEVQMLVDNAEVLEEIEPAGVYEITSDTVNVNMGTVHTHYRMPMTAAPCGTNNTFVEGGVTKNIVGNQNTSLPGWLNTVNGVDPDGTYFKYNLAVDSSLNAHWPPSTDFLAYAHIENNGKTEQNVLINANGIYWKSNKQGTTPWPVDYVNSGNTGSPSNAVVLVIDFIV